MRNLPQEPMNSQKADSSDGFPGNEGVHLGTHLAANLEWYYDTDRVSNDVTVCQWEDTFVAGELKPDLEAIEIEGV